MRVCGFVFAAISVSERSNLGLPSLTSGAPEGVAMTCEEKKGDSK